MIDVCETWTADSNALYDAEPPVHLHIKLTDGPSTWRGRPQVVDWLLRHGGIEVLIALACDAHVFRVSRWMEIVWKHYYPTDPMSALDHLDTPPMTGARTVLKRRIMRVWPAVRAVVANHANKDTIDD